MIESFRDSDSADVWYTLNVRKFSTHVQTKAYRKLQEINTALHLEDIRKRSGNKLKKLKGNLKGYYSIRINKQWRIIFRWSNGNAHSVGIIDYH